ncbi:c-type cytochrome [Hyphomonas sp.]|uniref:c-type cytochrome n=1 Tax=Hyphomonas sp. TaxID=87 RepID=UPI00391AE6BA
MRLSAGASLAALASLALAACGGASEPAAAPAGAPVAEVAAPETAAIPAAAPAAAEPSLEFAHLPEPYRSASYAAGVRTWKLCQSCHLTKEGAGNLVGPNLHGVFGRQVASAPGFDYSPALKVETFTWTPEQLDHWLQNPSTFVRGNRMSFAGVRKEGDRTAVIAYLMAETGYEAPPAE